MDDAESLLRTVSTVKPDLFVLDMPDGFTSVEPKLRVIEEEWLCPILVLSNGTCPEMERFLQRSPIACGLPKPVVEEAVLPVVTQCLKAFRILVEHHREIHRLRRSMDERRMLEKAKWVLGRLQQMNEAEAYELIRRKSRESRQPMGKIAEAIILAAELGVNADI